MLIIGCDFHPSFQQVAIFDKQTGEIEQRRLKHREEAEQFYRSVPGEVRVGMEACGHYPWFEPLLAECGHELWPGDASRIRAMLVRSRRRIGATLSTSWSCWCSSGFRGSGWRARGAAAADDASESRSGDGLSHGADARTGRTVGVGRAGDQLFRTDSGRALRRWRAAPGTHQQAGQFVSAFPACLRAGSVVRDRMTMDFGVVNGY